MKEEGKKQRDLVEEMKDKVKGDWRMDRVEEVRDEMRGEGGVKMA